MNDININVEKKAIGQTISIRDLHKELDSKKDFSNWAKNNLKNFIEGQDYIILNVRNRQNRKLIEYYITLDTAKHIALVSRCKKGKQIREYFIEVEKEFNNNKNDLINLPTYSESLRLLADQLDTNKKLLEDNEYLKFEGKMINNNRTATALGRNGGLNTKIKHLEDKLLVHQLNDLKEDYRQERIRQCKGYYKLSVILTNVSANYLNKVLEHYGYIYKGDSIIENVSYKGHVLEIETGNWLRTGKGKYISKRYVVNINGRLIYSIRWNPNKVIELYRKYQSEVTGKQKPA